MVGFGFTDGEDFTPQVTPEWNADHALAALNYLQGWLYRDIGFHANTIPEKSAQKIIRAADQILPAGRLDVDDEE